MKHALLALVWLAGPAAAQDDIVVRGAKLPPEQARREAAAFIRGLGVANGAQPVARWRDKACPKITGIAPELAAAMATRMRAVATAARVPIDKPGCTPNVLVTFASDAGTLVRDILQRTMVPFAQTSPAERETLRNGDAPIRWWYGTETRTKDNMSARGPMPLWTGGNAEGAGSILPDTGETLQQFGSSMVGTKAIRVITAVNVVIDAKLAEGKTLDTVADYAALVAFAEIRRPDFDGPSSVLGTFRPEGPDALTERDLSFLRALYNLPLDREARRHRNMLVGALVADTSQ